MLICEIGGPGIRTCDLMQVLLLLNMSALKVFEAAPDATGFDNSKRVSLHNMIPVRNNRLLVVVDREDISCYAYRGVLGSS